MSGKWKAALAGLNTVYLFLLESVTMLTLIFLMCLIERFWRERFLTWFCPLTPGFWVIQWHFHEFSGMFSFSFRSGFFHFMHSWVPPRFSVQPKHEIMFVFISYVTKENDTIDAYRRNNKQCMISLSLTHTLTHAPKHLIALLSWPNFCGVSDSVGLAMVISRYLSALSVRMQSPTVRRQQAEQRTWKHLDLYPPTLRNRKWALCDLLSGWWAVCWLPGLLFPSWFLQLQRLESMRDRRSQQYSTPHWASSQSCKHVSGSCLFRG